MRLPPNSVVSRTHTHTHIYGARTQLLCPFFWKALRSPIAAAYEQKGLPPIFFSRRNLAVDVKNFSGPASRAPGRGLAASPGRERTLHHLQSFLLRDAGCMKRDTICSLPKNTARTACPSNGPAAAGTYYTRDAVVCPRARGLVKNATLKNSWKLYLAREDSSKLRISGEWNSRRRANCSRIV